jgi:predicted SprT family Zn-dependent metalloprotease
MNELDAKRAITVKTNEVMALARRLYPGHYIPTPNLTFDIRGRSCGGRALYSRAKGICKVQYNLDWYAANPAEYLQNTVTHEIAHIVAAATGLGRGHNAGWVRICLALGGDGKRCNDHADVKAVKKARQTNEYLYRSELGREVWVGPVHHNRLQARGHVNPVTGRHGYNLITRTSGKIYRDGFTGQSRMKA